MKEKETQEMKNVFRSLDDTHAPYGLEDKIMKAVRADAQHRRIVRKNLRRAWAGVAATLLLFTWMIMQSDTLPAQASSAFFPGLESYSGIFMAVLSFFGLLFLFVEMEFLTLWLRKRAE